MLMKKLLIIMSLWILATPLWADDGKVMEISVTGMTCPFCAYGIEKKLNKLPGVEKAQVNLDEKKARVVMKPGQQVNERKVRKTIIDAGFTPGKAHVYEGGEQ